MTTTDSERHAVTAGPDASAKIATQPETVHEEGTAPLREGIERTRTEIAATLGAIETQWSPTELKEKISTQINEIEAKVRDTSQRFLVDARVLIKDELAEASDLLRKQIGETEQTIRVGVSEARDTVKEELQKTITRAKESARAATIGQVEHLATSLGDVMNDTRDTLFDTIRQNPVPAALAGVGLAWLLMNRSHSASRLQAGASRGSRESAGSFVRGVAHQSSDVASSAAHRASHLVSQTAQGVASTAQDALSQVNDAAHRAGQSTGAALHHVASAASDLSGQAAHTVSQFAHQTSEAAANAVEGARVQTRRVERALESTLHENPLAVGAAALLAGAAVGYVLPRTQREDEWMGSTRERFVESAGAVAHDAVEALGHMAEQTGDVAKHALDDAAKQPHAHS